KQSSDFGSSSIRPQRKEREAGRKFSLFIRMSLIDHLAFLVSHADFEFLPLENLAKVAGSPPRKALGGSLIGQRHPLGVEDLHRIDNMEVVAGHGASGQTRRRA